MIIRNTDNDLKDALLLKAERLGLTISNDQETETGIEHIELGHSISVGTSDKFHVNWARNIDYYAKRGIVPVYDIQLDWKKIVTRLEQYAASVEEDTSIEVDGYEGNVGEDEVVFDVDDVSFTLTRTDLEEILEKMDNV